MKLNYVKDSDDRCLGLSVVLWILLCDLQHARLLLVLGDGKLSTLAFFSQLMKIPQEVQDS